jgi:hypothetical protein
VTVWRSLQRSLRAKPSKRHLYDNWLSNIFSFLLLGSTTLVNWPVLSPDPAQAGATCIGLTFFWKGSKGSPAIILKKNHLACGCLVGRKWLDMRKSEALHFM